MNTISSLLNWIGNTIGANPSTLATTSKTLVGAINEVGGEDYIIDEGTSGDWKYRKWNSGTSECWLIKKEDNLAMTSVDGYAYYAPYLTYNFPSGIFNPSAPTINITAEVAGYMVGTTIRSSSKTRVEVYCWASRSITINTWVHIYAIGRWKS